MSSWRVPLPPVLSEAEATVHRNPNHHLSYSKKSLRRITLPTHVVHRILESVACVWVSKMFTKWFQFCATNIGCSHWPHLSAKKDEKSLINLHRGWDHGTGGILPWLPWPIKMPPRERLLSWYPFMYMPFIPIWIDCPWPWCSPWPLYHFPFGCTPKSIPPIMDEAWQPIGLWDLPWLQKPMTFLITRDERVLVVRVIITLPQQVTRMTMTRTTTNLATTRSITWCLPPCGHRQPQEQWNTWHASKHPMNDPSFVWNSSNGKQTYQLPRQ